MLFYLVNAQHLFFGGICDCELTERSCSHCVCTLLQDYTRNSIVSVMWWQAYTVYSVCQGGKRRRWGGCNWASETWDMRGGEGVSSDKEKKFPLPRWEGSSEVQRGVWEGPPLLASSSPHLLHSHPFATFLLFCPSIQISACISPSYSFSLHTPCLCCIPLVSILRHLSSSRRLRFLWGMNETVR